MEFHRMTIRHYCALVTVLILVGFPIVSQRFSPSASSVPEQAVLGRFSAKQIVLRAVTVTERLAPDEDLTALQWLTMPMPTYRPGSEGVRLWKVDGDKNPSGGTDSTVSLSFDADTGALVQFSRSTGRFDGRMPTTIMPRAETRGRAWLWLRTFEEVNEGEAEDATERKAFAAPWREVPATTSHMNARTTVFRLGRRTVQMTTDPANGMLLHLSSRETD
jgi:hypothetical protein